MNHKLPSGVGPPVAKPTRTVSDFSPWSPPLDKTRLEEN